MVLGRFSAPWLWLGSCLWTAGCLSLDDASSAEKPGTGGASGLDGAAGWPGNDGAAGDGAAGANACDAGLEMCSGACVDLLKNPAHCGACGQGCKEPSPKCVNGSCDCPEPWNMECNGKCKDIKSDESNCGACGNQCAPGSNCQSGACCPPSC